MATLQYFPSGFQIYDAGTRKSFKPHQIRYVKTAVGWYNVYLNGYDKIVKPVNLPPNEFFKHFPSVTPQATIGCMDVDSDAVKALGFDVEFVIEYEYQFPR